MKSRKATLVLPDGAGVGSLLTLTYEDPEHGPTPYHGIALRLEQTRKRLWVLFIYPDDIPEYVPIDLKNGLDLKCGWKVIRVEMCDVDAIRLMINDEGYYDKGEPYTVQGGRIESNRRRH